MVAKLRSHKRETGAERIFVMLKSRTLKILKFFLLRSPLVLLLLPPEPLNLLDILDKLNNTDQKEDPQGEKICI